VGHSVGVTLALTGDAFVDPLPATLARIAQLMAQVVRSRRRYARTRRDACAALCCARRDAKP
jgi:hypothetical protein